MGELVHHRCRELAAASSQDIPRRADANPASICVFGVLVGMGIDIRGQHGTVHALAHGHTAHSVVGKKLLERHRPLHSRRPGARGRLLQTVIRDARVMPVEGPSLAI